MKSIIVVPCMVLAGIGILLLVTWGTRDVYSEGSRVGIVTKFSHKGMVWKTWEGQLNLGGTTTRGDGNVVPNIWEFSIDRKALRGEQTNELVARLTEALDSGRRVKLTYTQEYIAVSPTRAETPYLLQQVEFVE